MTTIPGGCVARVGGAMKDKASQSELFDVAEQVSRLSVEALREGASPADALRVGARKYVEQAELALIIAKRNEKLNAIRMRERLEYVRGTWKGREAEGLRAILTGSVEGRRGARASVALEQKTLTQQYFGAVTTELRRAGLLPAFKSGALDQDITRALWQLEQKTPNLDGLPREAVEIARVVAKVQEAARVDANKAGAWIGKLEGWVHRQSHDPWKMTRAGAQEWISTILPRLDWARMEAQHGPIANREKWLAETYTNLVTGVHLKARGATTNSGFKGPGNLGKRMSQERVLHFQSADAFYEYNQAFGQGNLRESVFRGLRGSAENTGLMRVLGPNPEALFNRITDELRRDVRASGNAKAITAFEKAIGDDGWLSRRMAEVTGRANQAVDELWARRAANFRAWQSMSKLGGAVISSVTDLATYASELSYQGRGFFSGMAEAFGAIATGRPKGEAAEIVSSLGVFFDSMAGDITRTGSLDESFGGGTSRALQVFFDANLLNWWTDSLRGSAALSMSHHLALQATRSFDELAPDLQRTLGLFGIDHQDWNKMRADGVRTAEDGRAYLTPDNLEAAQADKLRRYIVDRAETAVLAPDADSRAMLRQGTRPGTVVGELARFIAQFKGFPVAFSRQVVGREIFGRGAEKFADGSVAGLARLIVTSTLLGYGAMSAKDMLKGRSPRDPADPKTWVKAMQQGGGAGIYGDFLFGEFNRFGQSPTETLAGPAIGTAADAARLWAKGVRGEADFGDALRLLQNNTPFLNLFYTRIALDYLILHDVQEYFAPGTLARMERRAVQDQGQTLLYRPSQDRLKPVTN